MADSRSDHFATRVLKPDVATPGNGGTVRETAGQTALSRRIEEASLNAWPALQQVLYDGWVLRFSKGFTRRANSVTPVYPATERTVDSMVRKVRFCEDLYAREGLPTFFRLTTLAGAAELDQVLADRGYERKESARVLERPLRMGAIAPGVGFAKVPVASFLATYGELTGLAGHLEELARDRADRDAAGSGLAPETAAALHGSVLNAIRGETVFGVLSDGGQGVACGMAVVEGELAGLFDIATGAAHRRQGYGRMLVQSLLAHAAAMGARHAYLQVLADNAPALALYEELGFGMLYEYWYRASKPGATASGA